MPNDQPQELLPCPSGHNTLRRESDGRGIRIICDCGWQGPITELSASADDLWNTRAARPDEVEAPDDARIAEIRERARKATAGPWEWRADFPNCVGTQGNLTDLICEDGADSSVGLTGSDNEFIAHAREDIPYLLSLVAALRTENTKLAEQTIRLIKDNNFLADAEETDSAKLRAENEELKRQLADRL